MKDLDGLFASHMREFAPTVAEHTPLWWFSKRLFIAGIAAGLVRADTDGIITVLADEYERCIHLEELAGIMAQVPDEHRIALPDGRRGVTELGAIHFLTRYEHGHPEDAERARKLRYFYQQKFQEARDQG